MSDPQLPYVLTVKAASPAPAPGVCSGGGPGAEMLITSNPACKDCFVKAAVA